jgi:hypothetical protein
VSSESRNISFCVRCLFGYQETSRGEKTIVKLFVSDKQNNNKTSKSIHEGKESENTDLLIRLKHQTSKIESAHKG